MVILRLRLHQAVGPRPGPADARCAVRGASSGFTFSPRRGTDPAAFDTPAVPAPASRALVPKWRRTSAEDIASRSRMIDYGAFLDS